MLKSCPAYFRVCWFIFLLACCYGINLALSYLHFVHDGSWAAWKPGIGITLIFVSALLSFIGYARAVRRFDPPHAPAPDA